MTEVLKYTDAVKVQKNGLLQKVKHSDYFIVQQEFIWWLDYENKKWKITIPKFFMTDMWSIPHIFRPFINRNKYIAYILHDYLYDTKQYSKTFSDQILRDAMKVEWAWFFERNIVYSWLLIWGWFARYY